MSTDPENTPLFSSWPVSSLPDIDYSKCIAIGDLLSQTTGPGSLAYSADFRQAAARRIAGLPPLKKDAKARVAPRRGLLIARRKLWAYLRPQGIRSQWQVEYEAAVASLAASADSAVTP